MDAFREEEPTITEVVKELYRKCPTLFQVLLTRLEHISLLAERGSEEEYPNLSWLVFQALVFAESTCCLWMSLMTMVVIYSCGERMKRTTTLRADRIF